MFSRERFQACMDHREPDRPPIDLGATSRSGIAAVAYNCLKEHVGLFPGPTRVFDTARQLAIVDEDVVRRFGIDLVDVGRCLDFENQEWYDSSLSDGSPCQFPGAFRPETLSDGSRAIRSFGGSIIAQMPPHGFRYEQTFFPYENGFPKNIFSLKADLPMALDLVMDCALPRVPWHGSDAAGFWNLLHTLATHFRNDSGRVLVLPWDCSLAAEGKRLRRAERFEADLIADPKGSDMLLDALLNRHVAALEKVCQSVGNLVDVVQLTDTVLCGHDAATSVKLYRQFLKSRHKKMISTIKQNSMMKVGIRLDGLSHHLIPELIDVGFDLIHPGRWAPQPMDFLKIKKEFGKDIVFWGGGCDPENLADAPTPDAVRAHVLDRLEALAPGGGFIMAVNDHILPETPPENIVAMFEAINEFSG